MRVVELVERVEQQQQRPLLGGQPGERRGLGAGQRGRGAPLWEQILAGEAAPNAELNSFAVLQAWEGPPETLKAFDPTTLEEDLRLVRRGPDVSHVKEGAITPKRLVKDDRVDWPEEALRSDMLKRLRGGVFPGCTGVACLPFVAVVGSGS